MAADLDRERLELERERLQAEIRHKEAALELEQRRFEASIPRSEPPSWRGTLKTTMLATAPLLTALIAPTLGLVQFGYSQVQSARASATARTLEAELRAETARQEASRAFNAKRLALYEKAISVTGKLASEPIGSDGFKRARRQFESFYWSQLPLVENEGVSNAMAELRTAVINGDAAEINQGVIELAKAVRTDLREIYGR